jgi:predicted homoserine dehydrogenase-like protein
VEILEEKLRKYFPYWLDISIKKIKEQIVNDANIIIIIDGVDQFIDSSGKDTVAKFWLPTRLPLRVKMILTVKKES